MSVGVLAHQNQDLKWHHNEWPQHWGTTQNVSKCPKHWELPDQLVCPSYFYIVCQDGSSLGNLLFLPFLLGIIVGQVLSGRCLSSYMADDRRHPFHVVLAEVGSFCEGKPYSILFPGSRHILIKIWCARCNSHTMILYDVTMRGNVFPNSGNTGGTCSSASCLLDLLVILYFWLVVQHGSHIHIYIYTYSYIYIYYNMQCSIICFIILYCIVLYDVVSYYVILYYCITRLFNLRFIYKTKWSQVVELSQRRGVDGNILRRDLTRKIFEKLGVGHQWPLTSLNLGNISSRW